MTDNTNDKPVISVHSNSSDDLTTHMWSAYVHTELSPTHVAMIQDMIKTLLPWIVEAVKVL